MLTLPSMNNSAFPYCRVCHCHCWDFTSSHLRKWVTLQDLPTSHNKLPLLPLAPSSDNTRLRTATALLHMDLLSTDPTVLMIHLNLATTTLLNTVLTMLTDLHPLDLYSLDLHPPVLLPLKPQCILMDPLHLMARLQIEALKWISTRVWVPPATWIKVEPEREPFPTCPSLSTTF